MPPTGRFYTTAKASVTNKDELVADPTPGTGTARLSPSAKADLSSPWVYDKWVLESELLGFGQYSDGEGTYEGTSKRRASSNEDRDGQCGHTPNKRHRSSQPLRMTDTYIHYCPNGRKPLRLINDLRGDEKNDDTEDEERGVQSSEPVPAHEQKPPSTQPSPRRRRRQRSDSRGGYLGLSAQTKSLPSVRGLIEEVDALYPPSEHPDRAVPESSSSQLPQCLHQYIRSGPVTDLDKQPPTMDKSPLKEPQVPHQTHHTHHTHHTQHEQHEQHSRSFRFVYNCGTPQQPIVLPRVPMPIDPGTFASQQLVQSQWLRQQVERQQQSWDSIKFDGRALL